MGGAVGNAWKRLALVARAVARHPMRALAALLRVLWACRVSLLSVLIPAWILIDAPQGRDLFSYFAAPMTPGGERANLGGGEALTVLYWAAMMGLTWAFWAYPVHASARIILYSPDWLFRRQIVTASHITRLQLLYRPLIVWVPRLLGACPFLALSLACSRALPDVPGPFLGALPPQEEGWMSGSSQEIMLMLQVLRIAFVAAAVLFVVYLTFLRSHGMVRPARDARALPRSQPLRRRYREAISDGDRIAADVAQSRVLLSMVTFSLIALLAAPEFFTRFLYLALVVPVVAGAWVPLFTWLTLRGQQSRLPLTTLALALLAIFVYFFGDNHDVTRSTNVKATPRPSFENAVEMWKAANQCEAGPCPRPIIVASAGGASRAAFFTLTVLGDLMDNPAFDALPELKTPAQKARFVSNRIFAISGVSGGAVGAAFYAAALANSREGAPPCTDKRSSNWFRAGPPRGWRDCLQAMLAEDYLSETIVGLSFRDNLNFLNRLVHWPDRAAILEGAWTSAFARWIKPLDSGGVQGLDQPFSSFARHPLAKSREPPPWQPLLILNGTSVSTGRRILTSHLAFKTTGNQRLFVDAYDLYEIFSGRRHCAPGGCSEARLDVFDVPLATAATNSARFPIISPPGTLRRDSDRADDRIIVDRIVDGGYFENDGITTTIDLVRALCEAGLCPVVLHIANDPLPYPGEVVGEAELGAPELPRAEDRSWLLFIRGPLGSLFATRSARASYALGEVTRELKSRDDLAEVLVYGEPLAGFPPSINDGKLCTAFPATPPGSPLKHISMSWWLSQPVQEYIDAQLKLRRNCAALDRVRGWLKEGVKGSEAADFVPNIPGRSEKRQAQ